MVVWWQLPNHLLTGVLIQAKQWWDNMRYTHLLVATTRNMMWDINHCLWAYLAFQQGTQKNNSLQYAERRQHESYRPNMHETKWTNSRSPRIVKSGKMADCLHAAMALKWSRCLYVKAVSHCWYGPKLPKCGILGTSLQKTKQKTKKNDVCRRVPEGGYGSFCFSSLPRCCGPVWLLDAPFVKVTVTRCFERLNAPASVKQALNQASNADLERLRKPW